MSSIDSRKRIEHELIHGKKLAEEGAESLWNWSSPAGQKRADRRTRLIAEAARISSKDKVLEIGCGTGLFTKKVHDLTGAKIVATDISDELLKLARLEFPAGDFRNEDAMSMSFPDASFDVVFGSSILHHLDMERTIREIYRVLKPGGRIAFAEPNMLNPQIAIQKNIPAIKRALGDSPDETAIIRWKFARMLASVGFTNVSIRPHDFLHPHTPQKLIPIVAAISRFAERMPLVREIAGSVLIYAEK